MDQPTSSSETRLHQPTWTRKASTNWSPHWISILPLPLSPLQSTIAFTSETNCLARPWLLTSQNFDVWRSTVTLVGTSTFPSAITWSWPAKHICHCHRYWNSFSWRCWARERFDKGNTGSQQWRSLVGVWGICEGLGGGGGGAGAPQWGPGQCRSPKNFQKEEFFFLNSSHFLTVKSLYFVLDAVAETGLMFQHFFFFCAKIAKNVLVSVVCVSPQKVQQPHTTQEVRWPRTRDQRRGRQGEQQNNNGGRCHGAQSIRWLNTCTCQTI